MAVNGLYVAAASTAASAAALQWWAASLLDAPPAGGDGDRDGDWLSAVLGSHVTVALLANLVAHVFLVLVLALKTLFFVQLTSSETRKVLEHIINYVLYKGTFLPLVVPPNSQQIVLWSTWLGILCSLKMFQSLARERLEQLSASPSVTPPKYFRVYSALLLVLSADLLWIKLCVGFCKSCNSKLFGFCFLSHLVLPLRQCR
ncbi:hypothetical protein GUJ93_ZPchr0007g5756 [Zizania palustris]|uniref:E3 ubiquitin-protein ligase synoviolin-like TPR repeats domain-containing protein n=1 Tax=Zizania palustris TaxID=103762 RepID=A0A8J5TJQ1_ZIZPA|nr:hypothetical protein GUJ93_ZPchr0007g5756 [Zizania palustris]